MMDALYCYRYFHSVQLHFKVKSYQFQKYGLNRNKFTPESFQKDTGQYFYRKMSSEFDEDTFHALVYSNLFMNPTIWVGDLMEEAAWNNYLWSRKFVSQQVHFFGDEVSFLKSHYGSIVKSDVFKEIITKNIHPDTVVLLERIRPGFLRSVMNTHTNIMYETVCERVIKYGAFVSVPDVDTTQRLSHTLKTIVTRED